MSNNIFELNIGALLDKTVTQVWVGLLSCVDLFEFEGIIWLLFGKNLGII